MYPGRPLYPDGKRRGIRDKLKKDRPLNGVRLQKSVYSGEQLAITLWAPGGNWCVQSMGIVCWSKIEDDGQVVTGIQLRRRLTPQDYRAFI